MKIQRPLMALVLLSGLSLFAAVSIPVISPVEKPEIPQVETNYTPEIPVVNEQTDILGNIENVEDFLNNAKETLLGEKADETEIQNWIDKLKNGFTLIDIIDEDMIKSDKFFPTFQNDTEYIKSIYKALFDKDIDDKTFQELYEKISSGKMSKEELLYYLAKKKSFEDLLKGKGINNSIFLDPTKQEEIEKLTDFVRRMYTTALGREAEPGGLNYWELMLSSGKKSPEEMAIFFFTSEEFQNQNLTDEEFLNRLYQTVFKRDADQEGFDYWTKQMEDGMTREDVIKSFIDSKEFQELLKEYGLK